MATDSEANWLDEALDRLPDARVAVFGDFCLDAYWLIDPDEDELSVETGLPVRRVREQRYSLGGAANVVANLCDLKVARVRAVGLVGEPVVVEQMRAAIGESYDGLHRRIRWEDGFGGSEALRTGVDRVQD